jgi:hypothetical protein
VREIAAPRPFAAPVMIATFPVSDVPAAEGIACVVVI